MCLTKLSGLYPDTQNFMKELKMNVKNLIILLLISAGSILADIPEGYYDDTEGLSGEELKDVLNNIISGHTEYSYNDLRDFVLPNTDRDTLNSDNVILIYTGWSYPIEDFGGDPDQWNREHVWAKSHGDFGNVPPCGTDAHHVRPCDTSVNSVRGNLDFDNGGNEYIDGDGPTGCYYDSNSWEPRDEDKGDVARMIFYMDVRYEGEDGEPDLEMVDWVNSAPNNEPRHGKKSTLLEWHLDDPVDDWERLRNDRIYNYQDNRNPFIDIPEFVARIWLGVSTNPELVPELVLELTNYPNPFNPETTIQYSISKDSPVELTVYNIKGQKVKTLIDETQTKGIHEVIWDGTDANNKSVSSGIYLYKLTSEGKTDMRKMMMLK